MTEFKASPENEKQRLWIFLRKRLALAICQTATCSELGSGIVYGTKTTWNESFRAYVEQAREGSS